MESTSTGRHTGGVMLLAALLVAGCATPEQDDRQRALALNQEALEAEAAGDDAAARQAYEELVALDPERPRAWFQLGNFAAADGELEAARQAFVNALEHDPEYQEARYNLGLVHMRRGAELLTEARDDMPESASTRATDVYLSCLLAQVVRNPDIEIPCPDLP